MVAPVPIPLRYSTGSHDQVFSQPPRGAVTFHRSVRHRRFRCRIPTGGHSSGDRGSGGHALGGPESNGLPVRAVLVDADHGGDQRPSRLRRRRTQRFPSTWRSMFSVITLSVALDCLRELDELRNLDERRRHEVTLTAEAGKRVSVGGFRVRTTPSPTSDRRDCRGSAGSGWSGPNDPSTAGSSGCQPEDRT